MLVKSQKFSKILLASGVFLSTVSLASPVYKATLPDGRVIYTDDIDTAYKQVTDNSQITVLDDLAGKPSPSPTTSHVPDSIAELASMNVSSTEASKRGDYQLTIQSPENETAYHRPAQQIDIRLSLVPSLKQGDTLIYTLDSEEIGQGANTSMSFASTDIDPGKHTLTVQIVNNMGQKIASSTSDFYVILTNPLIKKQKQLIAKRAEYEALPWYSKLGKHLKGEQPPIDPKKIDMQHLPNLELDKK